MQIFMQGVDTISEILLKGLTVGKYGGIGGGFN